MHNAILRAAVERTERAVVGLTRGETPTDPSAAAAELRASWTDLVKVLALGPAPEVRDCHACHRTVMRAATMCGHCWSRLPPLEPALVP